MRVLLILSLILVISCGKGDEAPAAPIVLPKMVYCAQADGYKICEVRRESEVSIFDKYTDTVLFGTIENANKMLKEKSHNVRLKE